MLLGREMGEADADLGDTHGLRVAAWVEAHGAPVPIQVGGFGAAGVGPATDGGAEVVFEFMLTRGGYISVIESV